MTQLHGLSLAKANLNGADFSCLRDLQSLQLLDLALANMSARDFQTLPRLESLRAIELEGDQITDEFVSHLARLKVASLTRVSLDSTQVSDAGLAELCAVYNLRYLNLYNSVRITGDAVDALARMDNLRTLGVGGTGLSPRYTFTSDVQRLRHLLPMCAIDYGD
jgi:hypothetical protein